MFYSQLLLSKKGALGIVWLAAHCHRRLKKDQIQHADISSSVDKILDDEVPVVTHRILAFLLLGVVRLYSKKVEYLFQDCHEVLNKLFGLRTAKRKRAGIGVSPTRYYSISLPKRFELDAFDLELQEDQDLVGENVRSHEQDMLADGREDAGSTSRLLLKGKMPFSEACSTAYTPPRDVFSSHHVDQGLLVGSSSNRNISLSGLGVLRGSRLSLEDRVDPIASVEVQLHDKVRNEDVPTNLLEPTNEGTSAPSLEKLRGTAFPLDDRLDPMILDEAEKQQVNDDRPSNDAMVSKFCGPIREMEFDSAANLSPLGSNLVASVEALHRSSFRVRRSPRFKLLDEAEKGRGHGEVESIKCQIPERVTPESKLQEVAAVRTPATKERAKIPRKKRKISFDSATVVSNKEFKTWIDDRSDLKRERRNVPRTLLHARRARELGHAPQSSSEPSIPATSVDLEYKRSSAVANKLVEFSAGQDGVVVKPPVVERVECEQIGDIRSRPEPSPIAPGTPVFTRSKSVRSHEARAVADPEILEPPTSSSSESVEKSPSLGRAVDSDFEFRPQETSSFEGNAQGKDTYSERTRMMGRYLGKKFLVKKKQKEEQVLNLSQLVAGKTKKESATLFYEILVLKTVGCVDVEQQNAYGDILVREVDGKLKQASQNRISK